MATARNAAQEASEVLGEGRGGRVLEPSPPAIDDGTFFADDPTRSPVPEAKVVGPTVADMAWTDVVSTQPDLADWAAKRWLVSSPLPAVPADLVPQREALHRLGTYVVAAARYEANGKFGLRWTLGGFGTPFFGDDKQVRVEGDQLVVQHGTSASATTITSLQAAADFIGSSINDVAAEHDSPPVGNTTADLGIDANVVGFLDRWWGLGTAALEQVRADTESVDPSRVQLWPGHFDPAMEVGDEDHRASVGASPGDASSDEPYLYISAWWPDRLTLPVDDPFWNATAFTGATLSYAKLLEADDPLAAAVSFFRQGRDRLTAA